MLRYFLEAGFYISLCENVPIRYELAFHLPSLYHTNGDTPLVSQDINLWRKKVNANPSFK
jgi:hypothetical protein